MLVDGLEATKKWLLRNVPSTPLTTMDDKREAIAQSYLELLTWDDANPFPEVLTWFYIVIFLIFLKKLSFFYFLEVELVVNH